jgi:hypothetical protein
MSRSSFHLHDSRSTFLYWFSLDTRFLAVITVVIWTGHLLPMALPVRGLHMGGSLSQDWRVWISPSCQVMVGGDQWLETVVSLLGRFL